MFIGALIDGASSRCLGVAPLPCCFIIRSSFDQLRAPHSSPSFVSICNRGTSSNLCRYPQKRKTCPPAIYAQLSDFGARDWSSPHSYQVSTLKFRSAKWTRLWGVCSASNSAGSVLDVEKDGAGKLEEALRSEVKDKKVRKTRRKSTPEKEGKPMEPAGRPAGVKRGRPRKQAPAAIEEAVPVQGGQVEVARVLEGSRKEGLLSVDGQELENGRNGDDSGMEKNGEGFAQGSKEGLREATGSHVFESENTVDWNSVGKKYDITLLRASREAGINSTGDSTGESTDEDKSNDVSKVVEEDTKGQEFVRALLEAGSTGDVELLLQNAEEHLGSGRKAWSDALRGLLMADKWQPSRDFRVVAGEWSPAQVRSDEERSNSAVARALQGGQVERALQLALAMGRVGAAPSRFVASQLMAALGRRKRPHDVEALFQMLQAQACPLDRVIHNCVVAAYGEAGMVAEMEAAVDRMRRMGALPDVVTYNTLISKYLLGRQVEKALGVLQAMRAEGSAPNARSYNTVLSSLCESGEVGAAHDLMRQMYEDGCVPSPVSYNILLKGYARAGRLDDMDKCFEEMVAARFVPNNITFGQCMTAYRDADNIQKVEEYFRAMPKYNCEPDVMTLSVLASAYGKAHRVEERAELYDRLDAMGYSYDMRVKRWVAKSSSPSRRRTS